MPLLKAKTTLTSATRSNSKPLHWTLHISLGAFHIHPNPLSLDPVCMFGVVVLGQAGESWGLSHTPCTSFLKQMNGSEVSFGHQTAPEGQTPRGTSKWNYFFWSKQTQNSHVGALVLGTAIKKSWREVAAWYKSYSVAAVLSPRRYLLISRTAWLWEHSETHLGCICPQESTAKEGRTPCESQAWE